MFVPLLRSCIMDERRAYSLVALLLLGCSTNASPPGAAASDASDTGAHTDASDDAPSCVFCGTTDADTDDPDASLGRRMQLRLPGCNQTEDCHAGSNGGLFFVPGNETKFLIDVASTERPELLRVRRGDPMNSYLYLKVRGDGGIEGGRMPLGMAIDPRLAPLVFSWIEAGAPYPAP
jgi:hypothetical protein